MSTTTHFDLVIIGGGPAGTRAAFDAAKAGMKTALVESGFLGGTCVNVGCIPTKYLLGGSAVLPLVAAQRKYKVAEGDLRINLAALQGRKERFVKGTRQALEKQLQQAGVTLLRGRGSFTGPQAIMVKGSGQETPVTFAKCIVATGSTPASFPGLKPDGSSVRSSAGALALTEAPESLIIVGGGAIGLELGEIFHRFGTKIILVEGMPRILPGEDPEVSEAVHSHFKREGWDIHTGRRISSLTTVEGRSALRFEDGEELSAVSSLVAVGRRPSTHALAPDAAGLRVGQRGWLDADEYLRCGEHVYAVGDANGRVLLAHAADHQARYAVAHASGTEKGPYAPPDVPSCIYGSLEVMRVGPTLAELAQNGGPLSESRSLLSANAIAQSYGHTQGFVRMIWEGDALRAVSAVGHGVSHLVTAAALLVSERIEKNMPLSVIFAHPTLDEALESAMVAPRKNIQ